MNRYLHTNIIARDWRALSRFYETVFDCTPIGAERDLSGEWVDELTGMRGAHITGRHLLVPGYGQDQPTLEIFSYDNIVGAESALNANGFSHIAFEVDDLDETLARLLAEGGSLIGGVVRREYESGAARLVYAADCEGNIVEIQCWD